MSDRLRVIAPPPLIFALPLVVAIYLQRDRAPWPFLVAAFLLLLLAAVLIGSAIIAFRRAATTVNPYGATSSIVEKGPYRRTRNPMYVAMALIYIGASLATSSWLAMLLLPLALLIVDRGVIRREEAYLTRRFGQSYTSYLTRVRRWL